VTTNSFGARLRREREVRQIDIADVAARTKIKGSLFEALERDDVSRWPEGLFRRSFIRAYAEAIGLDPQATLRDFLEHFPDPTFGPLDRPAPRPAPTPAPAAEAAPGPAQTDVAAGLRLTLEDADMPFQGGAVIADPPRRWLAAAWDAGVLLSVGLIVFVIVNRFWMPFSIAAVSYYLGGILLLGNSPGVCLFAPRAVRGAAQSGEPTRLPRARHSEPGRRPAEPARNPFRSTRRGRTTRT
jgi:transcriptional regulator with XRE-family HTH domain